MATDRPMQLGMVGLGRMGANLVQRLVRDGHSCVVYDVNNAAVEKLVGERVVGASSLEDLVSKLDAPRAVWLMLPAGDHRGHARTNSCSTWTATTSSSTAATRTTATTWRAPRSSPRRSLHYVDCGTSGGVWGLERGYSLMIGGEDDVVTRLDPIFRTIAPGDDGTAKTPGRTRTDGTAPYGLPALRTERRGPLRQDGAQRHRVRHDGRDRRGTEHLEARQRRHDQRSRPTPRRRRCATRSTTPSTSTSPKSPRSGVTARSSDRGWSTSPPTRWRVHRELADFSGRVSDSGEGRWTVEAAIDESVPTPVISAALWQRFESRG